jgi:hypothetical protein
MSLLLAAPKVMPVFKDMKAEVSMDMRQVGYAATLRGKIERRHEQPSKDVENVVGD